MSLALIIVIIIVGIILLFLLIAAVSEKDYSIPRQIDIDAPKQKVFDYVKMLKNQDYYNKWVMTDPQMKKAFTGTDGEPGFIYAWNGNKKAGEGEQEITTVNPGVNMVSEVRFVRPFPGISILDMATEAIGDNKTRIHWSTGSRMKFPMNAMLPMIKKMLAKDMDTSLNNLKSILEDQQA